MARKYNNLNCEKCGKSCWINKPITALIVDIYQRDSQEIDSEHLYVCLDCWEQEKDGYLSEIRNGKCRSCLTRVDQSGGLTGFSWNWFQFCTNCQKGSFGDFIVDELGGGKFCSQKCENERDEKEDLKALREMKRQHKLSPHLVTPLTLEQEKLLKQLETKYGKDDRERERERERERANFDHFEPNPTIFSY